MKKSDDICLKTSKMSTAEKTERFFKKFVDSEIDRISTNLRKVLTKDSKSVADKFKLLREDVASQSSHCDAETLDVTLEDIYKILELIIKHEIDYIRGQCYKTFYRRS